MQSLFAPMSRNCALLISLAREDRSETGERKEEIRKESEERRRRGGRGRKRRKKRKRRKEEGKEHTRQICSECFSLTVHVTVPWPAVFHLALLHYPAEDCARLRFLTPRNGHILSSASVTISYEKRKNGTKKRENSACTSSARNLLRLEANKHLLFHSFIRLRRTYMYMY